MKQTMTQIATRIGITRQGAHLRAALLGIKPAQIVGKTGLYSPEQVRRILAKK